MSAKLFFFGIHFSFVSVFSCIAAPCWLTDSNLWRRAERGYISNELLAGALRGLCVVGGND